MKIRIALLLFAASMSVCLGDPPTKTYDIDFDLGGSQFTINTKIQNTPRLVFNMQEAGVDYNGTGYTNILRYARNRDEVAMASITGTVTTTQAIFDTESGSFPHEMDSWYCVMMLVKGSKTYSYAEGALQVDTGNEATAPAALVRTYAINGNDYSPFTGSFSHWPFATTNLVAYVYTDDSWQSGTSTNAGTNTTVTFASAYTNIPVVQCEISSDALYIAEAYPITVTTSNFTYTIGSGAGVVTNGWRVYWQATPASGMGVTGYTDNQAISALSNVLGSAAWQDIGNVSTGDVPNWGMVQAAITNFGNGDVFASSNNTYSLITTQAMDAATANLFTMTETNSVVNGGFDTDTDWSYDSEWAIAGGLALCPSNALFNIAEIYQSDTTIIAGHTYRVSVDVVIAASAVTLVRARIGDSYGAFITTTGSYIQDITAVTEADDTMGFECIALATADTLVSLDNVTMIDLSRTITIDNGAVDIGGEEMTYQKIIDWDAKVGTEVDPLWTADKASYKTVADTTAAFAAEDWDTVMARGSTSSVDAVFGSQFPAVYGSNKDAIRIGSGMSAHMWLGPTNASYSEIFVFNPPYFAVQAYNSVGFDIPDQGAFWIQGGASTNLLSVFPLTQVWDFFGGTLTDATFTGTFAPTGTVDLLTQTLTNGTFAGEHLGNASNMTNVQPFASAWRFAYSDGSTNFTELPLSPVPGYVLTSFGSAVAPDWAPGASATATNVALADLTDVVDTNYFVVGDGANLVTQTLAATKLILGFGASTNTTFASMTMAGDTNEVIYQTGAEWTNGNIGTVFLAEQAVQGGKITGLNADLIDGINGTAIITTSSSVNDLVDVTSSGAAGGQVLKWNGSSWAVSNDLATAVNTNDLQTMWRADDNTNAIAFTNAWELYTDTATNVLWIATTNAIFDATNAIAGDWQADIASATTTLWTATTQLVNDTSNVLNTAVGDLATEVTNNTSAIAVNVISISALDAAMLRHDGTQPMTANLNMGGFLATNSPGSVSAGALGNLLRNDGTNWIAMTNLYWSATSNRLHFGVDGTYPSIEGLGSTNMAFQMNGNTYKFPE